MKRIIIVLLLISCFSYGYRSHVKDFVNHVISKTTSSISIENDIEVNSINFSEDFEDPQDWHFVNGEAANKWLIGTAAFTGAESTKGMYISNDGGATNAYTNNSASTVHAYKVMAIPAGTTEIIVSFDWRCMAEAGSAWDFMRVWITTDEFVPAGNTITMLTNQRIRVGANFNGNANWSNFSSIVNVSSFAGQNAKLIIEWRNDGNAGDNPPAAIDNITINPVTCSAPSNITSSGFTLTSADLSWNAQGTSEVEDYSYYYSTTNSISQTTVPSGTQAGTTLHLDQLSPTTLYYFWVRTNCTEANGSSIWIGPHAFSTLPENDECTDSIEAPVNADNECVETITGVFKGATVGTESLDNCSSSPVAKDVWYHFTATSTTHSISLLNYTNTFDTFIALYPDTVCSIAATPIACVNSPEMLAGGLMVGSTYKIRLYSVSIANNNAFTLCVKSMADTLPQNDDCDDSSLAPVNPDYECVETIEGTLSGATISSFAGGSCNVYATAQKEVWYHFTATTASHGVSLSGLSTPYNTYIEVYESSVCEDGSGFLGCIVATSSIQIDNLTIGETYKIRIYTSSLINNSDFTLCVFSVLPPIAVNDAEYTVEELVTDVLVGNSCLISNISYKTGTFFNSVNGIGYFSDNASNFPFEYGVVLATGRVLDIPGPAGSAFDSGVPAWLDDAQLTEYMNDYLDQPTQQYFNATILEFDFMPVVADFEFRFIFASNEYGEYQCKFSDAFAFFLTDPTTGETSNLALVPDTDTPISVVTIRKEIHSPGFSIGEPECGDANPDYFATCHDLDYNGLPPITSPINFYGLTIPMIAKSTVVPGETYHIKLVIQDRGDSTIDSAVFLDGGSFKIGNVDFGEDLLVENNNALCDGESVTLTSELDPGLFTFKWYKNGNLIQDVVGSSYTTTESGEYTLEAIMPGSPCVLGDTVKVEIYPTMDLAKVPNIEVCMFRNQIPPVDITVNETSILSNIADQTDLVVSYHETAQLAEDGVNSIPLPTAHEPDSLPMKVYVRVHNSKTGCTEFTSFDVIRKKTTHFKIPKDITTCIYHHVITPVDLTSIENALYQQASAGLQITYYENEQDAINLTSEITSLTAYLPFVLPSTIFVNVFDESSQCRSILNFDLVESKTLEPMDLEDIVICNIYVLVELPPSYYYSTEEFGKGELLQAGEKLDSGMHTIYINTNNEDGCVFSSSQEIEIISCMIPRGISPNGDGLNDTFDLLYYHPIEVKIFNRYGTEVYAHGPGYTNEWFGQSKNGKPLPDGTYFYRIITVTEEFTGYVQLIREGK